MPGAQVVQIAQCGHLLLGHEKGIQRRIRGFITASTR
jgi:hypothetical protein